MTALLQFRSGIQICIQLQIQVELELEVQNSPRLDWLRNLNVLAPPVTGYDRRWKRRGPDSDLDSENHYATATVLINGKPFSTCPP